MMDFGQIKNLSRADFLTSVGLYITPTALRMVRLRKSFLSVSVLGQENRQLGDTDRGQAISELTGWVTDDVREIALRAEGETRERALRQGLLSLLPHINPARDQVYVCVPQEEVIVQQVLLPVAAAENLQRVLDYEIERYLPFRRDEILYDFLPGEKRGEKLSVYVFAIPKRSLDATLGVLESVGIKPLGVETTVTALANYLLFTQQINDNGAGLIAAHAAGREIIGLRPKANGWRPAADLLFSYRFPNDDWAHGPAAELLLESGRQLPQWFCYDNVGDLNGLAANLSSLEDLSELGSVRLKGFEPMRTADAMPAVGAALHGVREGAIRTNFLRHEGESEGRGGLSLLNGTLLVLLLVAMAVWAASFPIKEELRLRRLEAENRKLEPAVQALRLEEDRLETLRKEAGYLASLEQRRGEILRVMDELSRVVPNNTYLSNLRYRAGILEIQGSAENASALIPTLERSPVFQNVNFNAPSNRGRDNRETFSVKAEVEKTKEPAKAAPPQQDKSVPVPTKEPQTKP